MRRLLVFAILAAAGNQAAAGELDASPGASGYEVTFDDGRPAVHAFTEQLKAHSCDSAATRATFTGAAGALKEWESARGVAVAPGARADLEKAFCLQANIVAEQQGISPSQIDGDAKSILWQYLDDSRTAVRGQTLADIMTGTYSLNASPGMFELHPFRPLDVNGQVVVDPGPVVMVEIGAVVIQGWQGNSVVCRGSIFVSSTVEQSFRC
jgi:hypothetical protein